MDEKRPGVSVYKPSPRVYYSTDMTFLQTDNLTMRALEQDDVEQLLSIRTSEGMRRYGGSSRPPSKPSIRDWVEEVQADESDEVVLGVEKNGGLIGYVGVDTSHSISRTGDVYVYFDDRATGKGHGTEAMRAFITYCFDELNMHKLRASVYEHNDPSIGLFEKLGFEREGRLRDEYYKQGEYRDIIRFGLLQDEHDPE